MNKLIILSAGHGGGDSGAVGQGTTEAAETIQIVNRAADKIRSDGQLTVVVVPHELGLIDTINWINARYKNTNDGIALDIHKNSTVNAHGIEVWYYGGDSGSLAYAQKALEGIMSVPGMPVSRGVKPDTSNRFGRLGFIRDTNPVALLYEMGFISDGGDGVDDASDDRYAEGILQSVLKMNGLTKKVVQAPIPQPAPAKVAYRVYAGTKQIGAYNTESGAWNKYAAENGTKIADSNGNDVTGAFVLKFRPAPVQTPAQQGDVHPVYDPAKDKEQDARLTKIEAALKAITDFLANFKWWGK